MTGDQTSSAVCWHAARLQRRLCGADVRGSRVRQRALTAFRGKPGDEKSPDPMIRVPCGCWPARARSSRGRYLNRSAGRLAGLNRSSMLYQQSRNKQCNREPGASAILARVPLNPFAWGLALLACLRRHHPCPAWPGNGWLLHLRQLRPKPTKPTTAKHAGPLRPGEHWPPRCAPASTLPSAQPIPAMALMPGRCGITSPINNAD